MPDHEKFNYLCFIVLISLKALCHVCMTMFASKYNFYQRRNKIFLPILLLLKRRKSKKRRNMENNETITMPIILPIRKCAIFFLLAYNNTYLKRNKVFFDLLVMTFLYIRPFNCRATIYYKGC